MIGFLLSDFQKIRRTWIPWLIFLAPVAFTCLLVVVYITRIEMLQSYGWMGLMAWANYFWPITLILGITILSSMFSGMEHDAKAWKLIFSLPVARHYSYISKFIIILACLLITLSLTFVGLILIGNLFALGETQWSLVAQQIFYPFFSAFPVISLQLWLAMTIRNQAIPLTSGIIGAMLSLFLAYSPSQILHYLPWAYVALASPVNKVGFEQWTWIGIFLGSIIFFVGGLHFSKRELK
ncbi:hypothetical protein SAMN06265361_101255 [Laceyella tengchongensis]|uniref:Permease n=1 Tax=Laceyella tengchongensis TaxID=574699 RepID=A0AA45WIW8_9BACL|nr:ABC transporter permease [Laceyella tengchongensis]SMP01507.1 hypothetical protein SAMN06265361_101255 [Laceyella tengchongensis]